MNIHKNSLEDKNRGGRKRNQKLDESIKETTLTILADIGYDAMTMDMVATELGSSKATIYRRWSSKPALVKDVLIWMARNSVDLDTLPDTGTLREDLLSVLKPYSSEYREKKIKVLSGLGTFFNQDEESAAEAISAIFSPWKDINLKIMKRALERGEISSNADIETACQIIEAMSLHQIRNPNTLFDKSAFQSLLDNILLPALKA